MAEVTAKGHARRTSWISSRRFSLRAIVLTAFSFFSSNMDVPAASSIIDRISCGRMLSTLVILPVPPRFRISTTRHNNNTGARGRTLHDEEVGVVDVELDALEQIGRAHV